MPIFRPGPLHVVTAGSMSALAKIERLELLPAVIEAEAAPSAVFDERYGPRLQATSSSSESTR